jgi:hypothetical protein
MMKGVTMDLAVAYGLVTRRDVALERVSSALCRA